MFDTEFRRRLAWLIAIRAIVSTILLGSATLVQLGESGVAPIEPLFFLIGLTYALTIFYAATLRIVDRFHWLVYLQLTGDALVVSAFIYVTGGVASYFSLLYVMPIVAASMVQYRRGGLFMATLSTALYMGVVLAQYSGAHGGLPSPWRLPPVALPARSLAQYAVAVNVFSFFVVALLSGALAEDLRSAGARLAATSTELADLQAFNQHVINSLPSGLVTADRQLRILTFNRAAEWITGVAATSAVGRGVSDVLQLPSSAVPAIDDHVAGPPSRRPEFRYRTADGRGDIEIGMTTTHLETPRGRAGYLFSFQDVTTIKKRQHDAALQQRLAAVGEMAAGIAHEIRNPLASMSGSIQILRQELPLSEDQEQLMDIVLRESERLNGTIRSFLAYARPQRRAASRFDVRRTLGDAARLLRNSPDVDDRHLVEVDVPTEELWLDADESQITQIVWNLATNGIRAMPEGGRLRLTARSEPASGRVTLSVQDEGIGIAPEAIDGLFQPFHGSFANGSGLGLAIVHRIVTDNSGEIQVTSPSEGGTTIAVHLPAALLAAAS